MTNKQKREVKNEYLRSHDGRLQSIREKIYESIRESSQFLRIGKDTTSVKILNQCRPMVERNWFVLSWYDRHCFMQAEQRAAMSAERHKFKG